MLILLEHKTCATFANYKTVAALAERTRRALRIVVSCREGVHRIKTADTYIAYCSLGTSGKHNICSSQTYLVEGIDYGI